jgi:glycosyltransferase involved in cell wall biosynthesis
MKPELSIIIPALNEEKHISELLNSIKEQNFPCEIIVADAESRDKTKNIAREYGAKVVRGGIPATGRNNGAKHAKSNLLLFLDADVTLQKGFLDFCCEKIKENNLDAATCYALPSSKKLIDKLNYKTANAWMDFFKKIKPYAHGFCIFAKKRMHNKVSGFNESIKFGEDSDYVNRISKIGNFDIIEKYVYASVRRFEKEGRTKSMFKYTYLNFRRLFGEIKDVKYDFGHY